MTFLSPRLVIACALSCFSFIASAQTQTSPSAPGDSGQAPPVSASPSQPAPSPSGDSSQLLKTPELDQLVAPIALYPDPLLSNVLMASTYPLEVIAADRFMKANKKLKGDALKNAVEKKNWDKSVAELTATPNVLGMMSEQLDWTQKLGDAVLAQQTRKDRLAHDRVQSGSHLDKIPGDGHGNHRRTVRRQEPPWPCFAK